MKTYAAGILFQSDKKIFLVKRADTGEWAVPGGKVEPGESPQDAARREVLEECLVDYTATMRPYTLIDGYVTYLADRSPEFTPKLDDENTDWGWFAGDELPENLHPGLVKMLASDPLNELQVAELIKNNQLTSPQFFVNMHLFAIRVTGTGISFRLADNQLTFRNPADYLNDEFLARCAGVPVIWLHPDKNKLDSEEFARRVVGTLINGWITEDNEVWGIARIYDAEAAKAMREEQLSTSPTVTYSEDQQRTATVNGDEVLIEDEPLLLDHVAICADGVWDKLKPPSGVKSNDVLQGETMTKEEFMSLFRECFADLRAEMADKQDPAKADATACHSQEKKDEQDEKDREDERRGENKALGKYQQTEKDREDERRAEDKALGKYQQTEKDREDERVAMERLEAEKAAKKAKDAKADNSHADESFLRREIDDLKSRLPEEITDEDRAELSDAQMKADSVFSAQGMRAPAPQAGERPLAYRRRILGKLKEFSPDYKDVDVTAISDAQILTLAERKIFADAQANASLTVPKGQLREIRQQDAAGRIITSFQGDAGLAWAPFKSGKYGVAAFNTQL